MQLSDLSLISFRILHLNIANTNLSSYFTLFSGLQGLWFRFTFRRWLWRLWRTLGLLLLLLLNHLLLSLFNHLFLSLLFLTSLLLFLSLLLTTRSILYIYSFVVSIFDDCLWTFVLVELHFDFLFEHHSSTGSVSIDSLILALIGIMPVLQTSLTSNNSWTLSQTWLFHNYNRAYVIGKQKRRKAMNSQFLLKEFSKRLSSCNRRNF